MKRTTEFVLGLIGSIFGFFGAIMALFIGGVDATINSSGESSIISSGWVAIFLSVLGIIGSVMVKGKPKVGGILMIVSAIGGLISIFLLYLLPFVLLLIAGLMGIFRKTKTEVISA